MTKFKVGDRVQCLTEQPQFNDSKVTSLRFGSSIFRGEIEIKSNITGNLGIISPDDLTFYPDVTSPIRTITRKEIVAGEYGSLSVYYVRKDLRIELNQSKHTPSHLREAAKNLIKIAEALEENELLLT